MPFDCCSYRDGKPEGNDNRVGAGEVVALIFYLSACILFTTRLMTRLGFGIFETLVFVAIATVAMVVILWKLWRNERRRTRDR